jgi:hypothetical protein
MMGRVSARKVEKKKEGYLVERMAAFGDYVRFLSREPEAETERFQANWALGFFFRGVSRGHDWHAVGIVEGERVGVGGSDLGRVRVLCVIEGGDRCRSE